MDYNIEKIINTSIKRVSFLNTLIFTFIVILSGVIVGKFFDFLKVHFYILSLPLAILSFFLFYISITLLYYRIFILCIRDREGIVDIKDNPKKWFKYYYRIKLDATVMNILYPWISTFPFILKFLGAKIGKNLIISGKIYNPELLDIEDNVIIGVDSVISGHIMKNIRKIYFKKIKIGKNCVIGAKSIILPGVKVGDNVLISVGTKVGPNVSIPDNTVI